MCVCPVCCLVHSGVCILVCRDAALLIENDLVLMACLSRALCTCPCTSVCPFFLNVHAICHIATEKNWGWRGWMVHCFTVTCILFVTCFGLVSEFSSMQWKCFKAMCGLFTVQPAMSDLPWPRNDLQGKQPLTLVYVLNQ